jgi:hypothetical protein
MRYEKKSKLQLLKANVLDALFIAPYIKQEILEQFCLFQKFVYSFSMIARRFKMRRAKKFNIDCDLYTTPFSSLPKQVLVELYDDPTRTKYTFRLSDLISLAHTSLTHAPEFFAHPLPMRNPYTNVAFTDAQLYTIYFALRTSPIVMPSLFHSWFLADFNLKVFHHQNECIIVNHAIINFIVNEGRKEHIEYILDMIDQHMSKIFLCEDFPEEELIKSLGGYLTNYLLSRFSLTPTVKKNADKKLRHDLNLFQDKNPLFGRKIYHKNQATSFVLEKL